jgi:hypothetical protein
VSRLEDRIKAGQTSLAFEEHFGYLRSLLRELKVSQASQMLVFSKTSLQHRRIGPRTPRSIYFNEDVYIGFCQQGDVLEVSAVDPTLGTVFYTLDQKPADRPRFARHSDTCLICHGSSRNDGIPGHVVRSVYPDREGYGIFSSGAFRIDHTTPLEKRWGGWYVTGTSGKQKHMGNLIVEDRNLQPEQLDLAAGSNVTDLGTRLQTAAYLTPYSDIVALMVLEHQAGMHNLITRAGYLTRIAMHDGEELNKALGRPLDYVSESTSSRIKNAGEPLVQYLLMSGEAPLSAPVVGTSPFAREFAQNGPRDRLGRSLRDLDLHQRLFRYPCSYLIYSPAFDGLPDPVRQYVLQRLWDILEGKDASAEFKHLSSDDRRAIREILQATKPNLPPCWKPLGKQS